MSDFGSFLVAQKPLCLGLPFHKELIKRNLYYILSERSEADFGGRNLFEQQCANVTICTTSCRGRPVPKYKELQPFIRKYDPEEGEWNGQPVWFLKVDTCKTCPFKAECTKLCPAMSAFEARNNNREDLHLDFSAPLDDLTDEWLEKLYHQDEGDDPASELTVGTSDIAWDCLSEPQKAAVIMILVQGKTFEQAAKARQVNVNSISKSYESGMAKLKEFGLARRALSTGADCKYAVEYYKGGVSQPEIAKMYNVSQYTVSVKLKEFRNKYDIKG